MQYNAGKLLLYIYTVNAKNKIVISININVRIHRVQFSLNMQARSLIYYTL